MRPVHPALYQVNTRVWLGELSGRLGRRATLADVPDAWIDEVAGRGFDFVWLLGVWRTGAVGTSVSRSRPDLAEEYRATLADLAAEDITGSPFAVCGYELHPDFGRPTELTDLRERLHARRLGLVLDFVPNHTARDHPWVAEHPERYVHGTPDHLEREPQNYLLVRAAQGERVLAHGRDPYFPGWVDTLQLNYGHAGLREAMTDELLALTERADGLRCDMAMLLLPDVFARTWGERSRPADGTEPVGGSFWREAIDRVRERRPAFVLIAEAYWDLEWELLGQGFDYAYDKRLYDRLRARDANAVRGHLLADDAFQRASVRFLENHDEPRAATAFAPDVHRAAATVAYLVPGLRLLHEGQLEGRRVRVPMQLGRRPEEPPDEGLQAFYLRLLECMRRPEARDGQWRLVSCRPAWDGNPTWESFLAFVCLDAASRLVVVVNYGATQGQCYVELAGTGLAGRSWALVDLLSPARYDRNGDELEGRGLYLDLPAWGHHVFEVAPADRASDAPPSEERSSS